MRVNAAWILLVLGFGAVGWIGESAFVAHPDLPTVAALILLAVCVGAAFRLCYHQTTERKERESA